MMKPILLGIVLLGLTVQSQAVTVTWRGAPFFIAGQNLPLDKVLKDLGANYGLPVIVSDQIVERYTGALQDNPPGKVLSDLARLYQLLPYYDGQTLYVYKAQEINQQLITPTYLSASVLNNLIQESGLLDSQACLVRQVGSANALEVVGVPVCLARVSLLAKQMDEQNLNQEQNRETVEVFPLKYANADDVSYSYRDQTVVIPGVVSVLRSMAQGHALPLPDDKSSNPGGNANSGLPTFSGDTRNNAVLVRDLKKHMPLYGDLIEKLDKRPKLVEISVAIIDVDAGDINSLGIDWSVSARIGGGHISFNSATGTADNFSSVVPNAGTFMVRLSALEQQSKAKIISHPSVVTLDNIQAVLDRNITFYTKVSSQYSSSLQSITTGELMRVTPHLIREGDKDRVLLTLNIQDGREEAPYTAIAGAETLPQVSKAEISTQATLNTGEALLLGGFVQDENTQQDRKIPLLGDLPILGKLFRHTDKQVRNVVRMFLIKAEPHQTQ